jgi:hypothetical protein
LDLRPGDYQHHAATRRWYVRTPDGDRGTLHPVFHRLTVEADETLTAETDLIFYGSRKWLLRKGMWYKL